MEHGRNTILDVSGLTISFPNAAGIASLDALSFSLESGKSIAIVGESGSGKSLTALSIMNLLPPSATKKGIISIKGISGETIRRGLDVSMIFQEPMSALNPVMSIGRQLSEAIRVYSRAGRKQVAAAAVGWLRRVHIPDPEKSFHKYPHQLSGGQKQRVLIAMAMCNNPRLLIADEPTTALDVTVQKEIIELMQSLRSEYGTSLIFITHDLALASEVADDVLVLYKGRTMEYGTAARVLLNPQHPYSRALLLCRPSAAYRGKPLPVVGDFLDASGRSISHTSGTPSAETSVPDTRAPEPLLGVSNLHIRFPATGPGNTVFHAVKGVSFSLFRGETLGLAGESGCGKSSVAKAVMGLIPVSEGHIRFKGQELTADLYRKDRLRFRKHIQMVFQDPYASLNPRLTTGDTLREALQIHRIVPSGSMHKETLRLLDMVQLPSDALHKYPHQFSGGQRQRIAIARALAPRPEVLICDESVSALDVSIQAQILNLLRELQQDQGLTYLFIAHDLTVMEYFCDRMMIMQSGVIVEAALTPELFRSPADPYTQKLMHSIPRMKY